MTVSGGNYDASNRSSAASRLWCPPAVTGHADDCGPTALTLAANDQYVSKSTMRFFLKHHTIHAYRN